MRIPRAAAVAVALTVVLLVACGSSPTPRPGVDGFAQDADFSLSIHADRASYRTTDPIVVTAELAFLGLAPDVKVYGDTGLVGFGVKQLDGHLEMGPASDLVCAEKDIGRLTPVHVPFQKSGGFSADQPDGPFWQAYFADPVLHLPAGTWRITAVTGLMTGKDCSPPNHNLTAGVTIQILP